MAQWGDFNFSEFRKMADNIKKAVDNRVVDIFLLQMLNDIANLGLRKTKRRTPTATGELRRNWYVKKATRRGKYLYAEIYNTMDYASFVENGFRAHFVPGRWSGNRFIYDPEAKEGMFVGDKDSGWVEGRFMLRISISELERVMPAIMNKKTEELLKKIFGGGK